MKKESPMQNTLLQGLCTRLYLGKLETIVLSKTRSSTGFLIELNNLNSLVVDLDHAFGASPFSIIQHTQKYKMAVIKLCSQCRFLDLCLKAGVHIAYTMHYICRVWPSRVPIGMTTA